MKVITVIEPACAGTADRRPPVACLPAGRSGRFSITWTSPHAAPSFRTPPDPPDGRGADPPREWFYELLFDDLPVPDLMLI